MHSFLAIVKLTCRSAVRSNVFRTLLVLLILSVLLIPNTILGDGTARGFIQLILEYSLGFVGVILLISSAWVACAEIATDVETGQIHLIAVKPVSRPVILLGKVTGVLLIHAVLLLIASAIVYGFVMYQYVRQDFPESERQSVENEILTGRRLYRPKLPDFKEDAVQALEEQLQTAKDQNRMQDYQTLMEKMSGPERRKTLEAKEKELRIRRGDVEPLNLITWEYEGLPENCREPLFLRYRVYFSDSSSQNQDSTYGAWVLHRFVLPQSEAGTADAEASEDKKDVSKYVEEYLTLPPEEMKTISTTEFGIQDTIFRVQGAPESIRKNTPADLMGRITQSLIADGKLKISFCNFDQSGKKLMFQEPDGPFLMVRETGFLNNYLRAVLMLFLAVAASTLIAGALAACFTLPTSIFMMAAYGLTSVFATYILKTLKTSDPATMSWDDRMAQVLSHVMNWLLVPFQDFFLTSQLASGQLVEFSQAGSLFFYNLVCRAIPVFLIGMLLYRRRELALAMKR